MKWDSDWSRNAACKNTDPDLLFVQGAAQNRVKVICAGCTVRTECLADELLMSARSDYERLDPVAFVQGA